jgi:hypothetical protein
MQELLPGVHQAITLMKAGPMKFNAGMLAIKAEDALVLMSPFTLPEDQRRALEALGQPTHIIIDADSHERDADAYRQQYGAKILSHHQIAPKLKLEPDLTFKTGDALPGGLKAIGIPGTRPGETALLLPNGDGALLVGDTLMNIPAAERGFLMRLLGFPVGLGKMPKMAIKDSQQAHQSYLALLELDFDALIVSHGEPILSGAKEALRRALA